MNKTSFGTTGRLRQWAMAFALAALGASSALASHDTAASPEALVNTLMARVGTPSEEVVKLFAGAGMQAVKPHVLTDAEQAQLRSALALLPAKHLRVLQERLHRLAFLDGIPGAGNGLTSPGGGDGSFDITLRADLFGQALGPFLTVKERRAFAAEGTSASVTIVATGVDALGYVMLHETTHVVSAGSPINDGHDPTFSTSIWTDRRTLAPALASSPLAETFFRTQKPTPVANAKAVYQALTTSPFVSLYATAAAAEDFAELVAWQQIAKRGGSLVIEVRDAPDAAPTRYAPLASPAMQARFSKLDGFLAEEQPS